MISNSIDNASSISNSTNCITKKKRANKSAKLKQSKLDARRHQWLSQVKNKDLKEQGSGHGEFSGPTIETKKAKGKNPCCKGVEVRNVIAEVIHKHDSDSEESSLANSTASSVNDLGNNYAGSSGKSTSSSGSSSLSFCSGGYCSDSTTEEEDGGGDDGCLDDWEAVADALVCPEANDKLVHDTDHTTNDEAREKYVKQADKVDSERKMMMNSKAWRCNDVYRPQSLPNLSKQWSFTANSEGLSCHGLNPWARKMPLSVPTSCPICCEDLDLTDSCFHPCSCGFRLCLFCHKRILEDDARCPGCRQPYTSELAD